MNRKLEKLLLLVIVVASTATALGQSVPPKATADPLATVWYLVSKSDPDQYESEKTCLAWSYFHVDRLPGIVAATSLVPPGTYHEEDFVAIAKRLVEKGRRREANEYVDLLLRRAQDNSEKQQLAGVLASLGREAEALALDPKEDGKPDAELYLTVADVIIKGPDPRRALRVLEAIEPSIVKSGEIRDRSMLALDFARLGEAEKAANLVKLALDEVVWKERDIEMDIDQRVALDDVTAALLRLDRFDEAESIIARRGFGDEGRWLLMVARAHYGRGDAVKGGELVDRLLKLSDPADYGDSFHLGDLVDDLLLRGRADRALTLAKSLSGSEYMRQMKLLKIADLFIRDKNFIGAADALDFAYAETSKIDVSEPESGSLWSSGQWEQAQYRARIALRLVSIGQRDRGLAMIRELKKPYLRAQAIAEFVGLSSKALPKSQLVGYLDESLESVRVTKDVIFDARRYEVYPIIAKTFASLGYKDRANGVFAEAITKSVEAYGHNLHPVCKIGVEYDKSRLTADAGLRSSLARFIKEWEQEQ